MISKITQKNSGSSLLEHLSKPYQNMDTVFYNWDNQQEKIQIQYQVHSMQENESTVATTKK